MSRLEMIEQFTENEKPEYNTVKKYPYLMKIQREEKQTFTILHRYLNCLDLNFDYHLPYDYTEGKVIETRKTKRNLHTSYYRKHFNLQRKK